jgi:hypothetical protein
MTEDREERAHRERSRRRGPADLEVDGKVATAVFQTREGDDGVQEEEAKPMVCRTQILVSCNTTERWLEIRYPSVRLWARAHATFTGRKWG